MTTPFSIISEILHVKFLFEEEVYVRHYDDLSDGLTEDVAIELSKSKRRKYNKFIYQCADEYIKLMEICYGQKEASS